jgi:hypothetical protein
MIYDFIVVIFVFVIGLVVDYPNSSKSKKFYLCLSFERSYRVPTALGTADGTCVQSTSRKSSR